MGIEWDFPQIFISLFRLTHFTPGPQKIFFLKICAGSDISAIFREGTASHTRTCAFPDAQNTRATPPAILSCLLQNRTGSTTGLAICQFPPTCLQSCLEESRQKGSEIKISKAAQVESICFINSGIRSWIIARTCSNAWGGGNHILTHNSNVDTYPIQLLNRPLCITVSISNNRKQASFI